jgi:hypothetical protein
VILNPPLLFKIYFLLSLMPFHKLPTVGIVCKMFHVRTQYMAINGTAIYNKSDFTKYRSLKHKFSSHECKIISIMNSVIHNDIDSFLLQLSWNRPPYPSKREKL